MSAVLPLDPMLCAVLLLLSVHGDSCKEAFDSALSALRQRDPAKANEVLNNQPKECSQFATFYELKGVADDLSGDSSAAEHAFEQAVSLQPAEPRFLEELGTAYLKGRKLEAAADVLSRALRADPANVTAAKYLIAAYVGLNRWPDVLQVFDSIEAGKKPGILSEPVTIMWFARALIEAKRTSQIDVLLSSIQTRMASPLLFSLGELFAQHKMYPQVVRVLNQIPAQDVDDAVSFNLGLAYSHLQQFDQARHSYFRAIDKHPGHPDAYLHVGLDFAMCGDSHRAIPWLARAHELTPNRPDVAYALTEQLLQLGYTKSAEDIVTKAMPTPGNTLLLVAEGDLEAAHGESGSAAEFYRQALVGQNDSVAALVGLARADLSQAKDNEAREVLQRALLIDPEDPPANGALGMMELRQARWESAVAHLRSSWEKDQSNPEVLLGLANAYSHVNRWPDALHLLEAAGSGPRDSPAFHQMLSKVYTQLHRTSDAQKEQELWKSAQSDLHDALRFDKPQSYVF